MVGDGEAVVSGDGLLAAGEAVGEAGLAVGETGLLVGEAAGLATGDVAGRGLAGGDAGASLGKIGFGGGAVKRVMRNRVALAPAKKRRAIANVNPSTNLLIPAMLMADLL